MIRTQNIYHMLAYAFQTLQGQGYRDIAAEEFDNTADLLAEILSRGVSLQLKRGLGREYVDREDMLSSPRGKIELSESLKTRSILRRQLVCSYDEFSTDTDTLTGMYNRMGYQQLGEESFRISGLNKRKLLILFVDLDRLKYINDTFGHEYGDMAICAAARALMQCSSRDAVPARTGGDEFVLIQSYQSDEVSRELVLRIRRTLEAEGKAQKLPFPLSMSIGTVVTDPESALSFADYVKIADSRMYEEKVQKRAARK